MRSLRNKVSDVHAIIHTHNIDILAITETWLDPSIADSLLYVPGYCIFRHDRKDRPGGGVCIYVRNSLTFNSTIYPAFNNIEHIAVNIRLRGTHDLIFLCCYRPPSSTVDFWTHWSNLLDTILEVSSWTVVLGDLNCDTLASDLSSHTKTMMRISDMLQLRNVVTCPTRFPTATCIDAALVPRDLLHSSLDVTTPRLDSNSVTPVYGFTDHFLVTLNIIVPKRHFLPTCQPSERWVRRPPLHTIEQQKLKSSTALAFRNLSKVEDLEFNDAVDLWQATVLGVLDDHCPRRKTHIVTTTKPKPSPWCTPALQFLLRNRKHLHRALLKHPDNLELKRRYQQTRREGTLLNRRLKSRFYQLEFYQSHRNPRQQWQLLNRLLGRNRVSAPSRITPDQHANSLCSHCS